MLKMDAEVGDLVRNAAATAGGAAVAGTTYAVVFGTKSKFSVVPTKHADFFAGYCELAAQDEAKGDFGSDDDGYVSPSGLGMPIAEVAMTKTLPIIVGMTLRFHLPAEDREDPALYAEDFIKACVNTIQELMATLLAMTTGMSELICLVCESKSWHVGETTYTRLLFQFPYAQVDAGYQRHTFKPFLIRLLRTHKVISKLEVQPIGDWDTIIEEIKDGVVPMYRSKTSAEQCPVKHTHTYEYVQKEHIDTEIKDLDLRKVFIPTYHSFFYTGRMTDTFLAKEVDIEHWLPLFFSINYWSVVVNPKPVEGPDPGTPIGAAGSAADVDELASSKDPMHINRHMLSLLGMTRFDTEPHWLDIGRVLYNSTNGGEEGLSLWIQYSARSAAPGRDKAACGTRYATLRNTHLSWKTMVWFVKEDTFSNYQAWHTTWCQQSLNDALNCTNGEVAEAIWRTFCFDYMCTSMSGDVWYKFVGHVLKKQDSAAGLRKDITEKLIKIYAAQRTKLSADAATGKESERKGIEHKLKEYGVLIRKLNTDSFRNSTLRMCRELFHVPDFDKIRDSDPMRTGWANCVIECCSDRAYVRPGKPEDYITMNTGLIYRSDLSRDHPLVVELMTWLSQCFPDEELLRYFLKDAACMLMGRNAEKLFRAWVGDGDNSKSMIVKLFKAIFGCYCVDFPTDMLTKSMGRSSGPTPELAQARGAHMGIVSEPDESDTIQAGKAKGISGGDGFFARNCCENGGSLDNFLKIIYMANRIPDIPGADKAFRARFQILPFLSTWLIEGAPEDPVEQMAQRKFKMDPFFENRIPDLAYAGLWLMVEYFPIYKREGLKPPKVVIDHTARHWEENDPFLNFIRERIVYAYKPDGKEIDVNVTLCASDIFPIFNSWYVKTYPGATKVTQPIFTTHMKQAGRLGEQSPKRRWVGIRVNAGADAIPILDK